MKLKVLFGICVFILMSFTTFSQEYINSGKLIEKLEQEVNDPSFDMKKVNMFYNTFHIDREDHKIDLHPSTAEKKVLYPEEIYEKRLPNIHLFLQVYESNKSNKLKINGAGTAFPISEDGHFLINLHIIDDLGVGSGDPSKVDTSIHLILADYRGTILTIDSVVTYNRAADIAILKANTNGKKIASNPLGQDLKAGMDVFAITHPRSYYYYFSTGRVARMIENDMGVMSRKMEITADYAAESSGGPIFDNKGNIAGIVSLTKSFYYDQSEQKNLQMVIKEAVPVSTIWNLIN